MGYAPGADAVPMAVKYLFDFLDDEAEAVKILDPDMVYMWKNNALSIFKVLGELDQEPRVRV